MAVRVRERRRLTLRQAFELSQKALTDAEARRSDLLEVEGRREAWDNYDHYNNGLREAYKRAVELTQEAIKKPDPELALWALQNALDELAGNEDIQEMKGSDL